MSIRLPSRVSLRADVALVSALSRTAVASASIENGGFESPGTGSVLVFTGQTDGDWTCVGSNVGYVHAAPNPALPGLDFSAYEGNDWIDLGGVGGPSGIEQDIAGLVAGQAYRVRFAQAGNVWGPDIEFTLQVSWNGAGVGSFSSVHGGGNGVDMNWQERYVDMIAAEGLNRLQFLSPLVVAARGALFDAVSIAPIPGPGALAVFALAGLRGRRRR